MNEFKSKAQSEEIWKVLSNARTVGNFSKKSKKNIGWIVFCKIDGAHKRLGIFATEEET
jgi:hypothetical protein